MPTQEVLKETAKVAAGHAKRVFSHVLPHRSSKRRASDDDMLNLLSFVNMPQLIGSLPTQEFQSYRGYPSIKRPSLCCDDVVPSSLPQHPTLHIGFPEYPTMPFRSPTPTFLPEISSSPSSIAMSDPPMTPTFPMPSLSLGRTASSYDTARGYPDYMREDEENRYNTL